MTDRVQQPNDLRVCQQILAGNRHACTWPDCSCPKHPADASSNHAANLEGIDNTGAGRSQTTDSANLPAIPNSAEGCPHGCKKESDCLRYDQGGSIPADCALYAAHDWPAGEDEFYAGANEPDVIPNRAAEIATFDDEVCRASKGHCGRHGCCEGDPPYEACATPNHAAELTRIALAEAIKDEYLTWGTTYEIADRVLAAFEVQRRG